MPLFGSHLSIAGGYYKAVNMAAELGLKTVQMFTKSNNQWAAKPLTDEDVRLFHEAVQRTGVQCPCAHNSYLINLASPDEVLWKKSLDALVIELERAEVLGLAGVVMHPGSFVTSSADEGQQRIVKGLDEAHHRTKGIRCQYWLETTAGQGSNLGYRFEQIGYLLDNVRNPERLGVCVDSCHIFAAGYPLQTKEEYAATMDEFERHIGVEQIRAWHLNDSKKPLGSRVDRHEHIGEGFLGLEPFRHIVNDIRFADTPMYLETEKGERDGVDLDVINLATLNSLIATKTVKRRKR
jgi:deoxyribonuclease IV